MALSATLSASTMNLGLPGGVFEPPKRLYTMAWGVPRVPRAPTTEGFSDIHVSLSSFLSLLHLRIEAATADGSQRSLPWLPHQKVCMFLVEIICRLCLEPQLCSETD